MWGTIGIVEDSDHDCYDVTFYEGDANPDAAPTCRLHGKEPLLDLFHLIGLTDEAIQEATDKLETQRNCTIDNVRIHVGLLRRFRLVA